MPETSGKKSSEKIWTDLPPTYLFDYKVLILFCYRSPHQYRIHIRTTWWEPKNILIDSFKAWKYFPEEMILTYNILCLLSLFHPKAEQLGIQHSARFKPETSRLMGRSSNCCASATSLDQTYYSWSVSYQQTRYLRLDLSRWKYCTEVTLSLLTQLLQVWIPAVLRDEMFLSLLLSSWTVFRDKTHLVLKQRISQCSRRLI